MNQIQRSIFVHATRARVWKALTTIEEFCRWFTCTSNDGEFRPGARVHMESTHEGCGGPFFVDVVEMVAEQKFSWRWHPGTNPTGDNLSAEPMTLVTFTLEDADGGTRITVTETGFDQLFESRRSRVFGENEGGWKHQMASLTRYFGETA